MGARDVRERPHRLPRWEYQGRVVVAFTLCVQDRVRLFESDETIESFVAVLADVCARRGCCVPIYCFMPDHLHVLTMGLTGSSDGWQAMVEFKQRTGYWLTKNRPFVAWQRSFFDHVLRTDE